ncbi:MAG: hypothetical protein QM728_02195 [Gordonia sp. (in: high G+C Gram-positive bacteria)]|uniref:hypothetical protein n=1 Tax=Gordonia sp. (in: high G+C Gram-positive bacteria) TaxID=84139 RepID=UPI0039E6AFE0
MFVVTADQRASRADADRVPDLLRRHHDLPAVRGFERTAGDEVEAVFGDPATVASVVVDLVASGHWSVGIGVDDVEHPLPAQTRAGRGPAFEAARAAVETAKGRRVPLRVVGPSPWCVHAQTAACLLVDLIASRSEAGREAVALVAAGDSQAQAAEKLGITPQAMSLRLKAARWDLQPDSQTLVTELLRRCEEDR